MASSPRRGAIAPSALVAGVALALVVVGAAAFLLLRDDSPLALRGARSAREARELLSRESAAASAVDAAATAALAANPSRTAEPAPPGSAATASPDAPTLGSGPPDGWPVLAVERATDLPLAGARIECLAAYFDSVDFDRLLAEPRRLADFAGAGSDVAMVAIVTDEQGIARVPIRGDGEQTLFASCGALRGVGVVSENSPRPLRLELAPSRRVAVHVVDRAGVARADVPVRFGRFQSESDWDGYGRRARTDERGDATLDGVDLVPPDSHDSIFGVRVLMLGPERVFAPIDPASPPTAPVTLVLPDCGTVVARVTDADGATWVCNGSAKLDAIDAPEGAGAIQPGFVGEAGLAGGSARWPTIALGLRLRVEARIPGADLIAVEGAGPARDGEVVELAIPLAQVKPWIVGRVATPDGWPVMTASLTLRLLAFGDDGALRGSELRDVVTDRDGRFRVDGRFFREAASGALALRGFDLATGTISGAYAAFTRIGEQELVDVGTLRLHARGWLAAAAVVDDAGAPVRDAECWIETDREWRPEEWAELDLDHGRSDDRGRVAFCGDVGRIECTLHARKDGLLEPRATSFTAGATDVRVVLPRPGRLVGSLRATAGTPLHLLSCELRPRELPDCPKPEAVAREIEADGRFEFGDLWPGSWDASIHIDGPNGVAEELLTIPRIAVVGGATCVDPRLQSIDVVGRVRSVSVRVFAPDGSPADEAFVHAFLPRHPDAPVATRALEDGVATFATLGESLDVEVWARGCRIERVADVRGAVDVQLRPSLALPLTVHVDVAGGIEQLPFPIHVEVTRGGCPVDDFADWLQQSIDDHSAAHFELSDPGRWEVRLVADHSVPIGGRGALSGFQITDRVPLDLPATVVDVHERGDPAEATIRLDAAAIAAAERRLAGGDRR